MIIIIISLGYVIQTDHLIPTSKPDLVIIKEDKIKLP